MCVCVCRGYVCGERRGRRTVRHSLGVVRRGCVCCARYRGVVMSRYGCFVLVAFVNICNLAPYANAGCAVQQDPSDEQCSVQEEAEALAKARQAVNSAPDLQ
mgnify:CR=1 FL=1